jgi:hypothetical protein
MPIDLPFHYTVATGTKPDTDCATIPFTTIKSHNKHIDCISAFHFSEAAGVKPGTICPLIHFTMRFLYQSCNKTKTADARLENSAVPN